MSTTTVGDLVDRAETLTRQLRINKDQITGAQWRCMDATVYRLLAELNGPERTRAQREIVNHAAVTRVVDGYPSPLASPGSETTYTAKQAASHLGVSRATIVGNIRRSQLPATYDGRRYSIKAADLSPTTQVQQADPASAHPLDRLACTLGVLADLVAAERSRLAPTPGFDPLRDDTQVTPVMGRVLAVTLVAARHTLVNIALQDADRPLAIARYATSALDALGDVNRPSSLNQVASFAPPLSPSGPNEELEAALRGWATQARNELAMTVPSTKVLRDITNQARHLYAVSARLAAASATAGHLPEHETTVIHSELREAAEVMNTLQQQWKAVTTATRPGHEYVTATTTLHASLSAIERDCLSTGHHVDATKRVDVNQALTDLRYAATDLVALTHTAAQLPEPLIRSGLLFAPARILPSTMERLRDRNQGRYVAIQLEEGAELIDAAQEGSRAARHAHAILENTVRPTAATELSTRSLAARITGQELELATDLGGPDLL
ncbi:MAG: hypothetical protein ABI662_12775 [Dermatophilaceae bacterium]